MGRFKAAKARKGLKIDFASRDENNRKLGRAGEEWVVAREIDRLSEAGNHDLAKHVRWVSEEEGDGLGYDIRSFHDEGKPLYIEVKTTNGGAAAPFYVSPNEVEVSKELKSHYAIYRVFDFAKQPRVFVLRGSIAATCKLEPSGWKASVKDDLKDS